MFHFLYFMFPVPCSLFRFPISKFLTLTQIAPHMKQYMCLKWTTVFTRNGNPSMRIVFKTLLLSAKLFNKIKTGI